MLHLVNGTEINRSCLALCGSQVFGTRLWLKKSLLFADPKLEFFENEIENGYTVLSR